MQASTTAFGTVVSGVDQVIEHAISISLPIKRQNLCTSPSFDDGLGDWRVYQGVGGTGLPVPTRSATQALVGSYSMHVNFVTTTASGQQFVGFSFHQRPGVLYAVSCWLWLESACGPLTLTNGSGANTVSTRGSWQQAICYVTGSNWNSGNPLGFLLTNAAAATSGANTGFYIDAVMIEEIPTGGGIGSYFDGDTGGGVWDGTPGFSTSTLNVDPYPDVTLAVDKIHIERQISTNLPAESTLIDGYPTGSMRLTLSGLVDQTDETKTAAWLFGPDETTSPLYGLTPIDSVVTVDQGVYTGTAAELIRTFTGYVDDCVVDSIAGTVELTVLDPMTRLRPAVQIPSVSYRNIDSGDNAGLTGGWVMEAVLRQNGVYSSPPPRQSCILYASMHGSAYPEVVGDVQTTVNMNVNTSSDLFVVGGVPGGTPADYAAQMIPGVWGSPVVRNPAIDQAPIPAKYADAVTINSVGSVYFETWAYADPSQAGTGSWITHVDATSQAVIEWHWTLGAATCSPKFNLTRAVGGSGSLTLGAASMTTGAWHHVSVLVSFTGTTTATVTVTIDGVVTVVNLTGLPLDSPGDAVDIRRTGVYWNGWLDTFQITGEPYGLPYGAFRAFTPTAYLDPSLNPLVVVADTTGLDAKSVIAQLAEAERGVAGFDEHGVFRFKNRNTLIGVTSTRTVTSSESLKALQTETGKASVATHVQVPSTGYTFAKGQAYNATDAIMVAKNSTKVITATTSGIAVAPLGVDPGLPTPTGGWPTSAGLVIGWRAATTAAGAVNVADGIAITARNLSATEIEITIVNSNGFAVYFVSSSAYPATSLGLPNLTVFAELATSGNGIVGDAQWPPIEDGGAPANTDFGEVLLPVASNPWMQDGDTAQTLANDILADEYRPRAIMQNVSIVPDPRLQLGDRVTISDPDGSKMIADAYVFGLILDDSGSEWNQTINFRRISNPGDWVMGIAGFSEMGVTTRI